MTTWICPCGQKRELDLKHSGAGVPACPHCRAPMELQVPEFIPGLAKALTKLDRQSDIEGGPTA